MLPFWMRTEENVRELFTFLGFNTLKCSIQGRQIDLIATLKGKFQFQDENLDLTRFGGHPRSGKWA